MKCTREKDNGITLIALIVTIVILLLLSGITIATLGGENGLITRAKQARQAQIESEMKEQLTLALQDLQIEKSGDVTLDDVTQEWIDAEINNCVCTVKDDLSISGKKIIMEKDGIICKFLVDGNLNITEIEDDGNGAVLEYEVLSRDGDNVNILITITDKENGLQQVEFPDGNIIYCNGNEEVAKDYEVQLGVEYKVRITSKGGQVTEKTILISDYYHKITKNLGEGISIDNVAVKAAYNKPYQATIIVGDEYIIDTFTVTMGGQTVVVNKTTGTINIEKVTGDIEITANARKLEIQITTPIIGSTTTATSSVTDNSQTTGTTLYINLSATLEGTGCIISPEVPYSITRNGKYNFTINGTYEGKTVTKEIEIQVYKYKTTGEFVSYDAGDWTEEEINSLKASKLYDINTSHTTSSIFKLNSDSGFNFTFGGFTYKGDTTGLITSRNKSATSNYGTPKSGWQILETVQSNGKIYVTKLAHAGQPENFVYYRINANDAYRAEYLLSNGERKTTYTTLSNGIKINPRNWDMYKDQSQLDLIDEVHCMTYDEALGITGAVSSTTGMRRTNNYYWLANSKFYTDSSDSTRNKDVLWVVDNQGTISVGNGYYSDYCFGIRPVVSLKSGVYILSGSGTEADPYVLAKED